MPLQGILTGEGFWASRIRAKERLWGMNQRLQMPRHITFSIAPWQTQFAIFLETESAAILRLVGAGFSARVGTVYGFPLWFLFFFSFTRTVRVKEKKKRNQSGLAAVDSMSLPVLISSSFLFLVVMAASREGEEVSDTEQLDSEAGGELTGDVESALLEGDVHN
jgi:hypothetical protein